ncbi:MAG: hypothetical protein LBQ60_10290 [Bacteroidales bacterium]|jgi:hypothetical protein|nr:hypothetical protein [Bacteroidales bacterium]
MDKNSGEKSQIKKEIKSRISRGEPKQQILEDLSQKYKDKITIVKQLEITPSVVMKQKYYLFNILLFTLLLAALVLDTILLFRVKWINPLTTTISYLNVGLDIMLLLGAGLYRIESYSWISARAIVSILQIIITHAYYQSPIDTLTFISLGLVVISFLLGLFLSIKLCPPRIPKTIEVDIDEKEKIKKTVYVFPD